MHFAQSLCVMRICLCTEPKMVVGPVSMYRPVVVCKPLCIPTPLLVYTKSEAMFFPMAQVRALKKKHGSFIC